MPRFDLTAGARHTDGASLLEQFLDDNAERIPPELFRDLDDLAGEIEGVEEQTNNEKDDLKREIEDLENRVETLEQELEELQNDNE